MSLVTLRIFRGEGGDGEFVDYKTEFTHGMVVLDVVHKVQAEQAGDLACRWNCKAGKCGSCSAEINGKPRLLCMTRMDAIDTEKPVTVEPMQSFPHMKDLVTDVSSNYRAKLSVKRFSPRPPDNDDGTWNMKQADVDRVQEFRKCIECFLCQDVCHVLREHHLHDEFIGPRHFVYSAALEMHPLDTEDRLGDLKAAHGVGYCNITKCCTKVCPEHITITDNAIIPLKERVVDEFFDPMTRLFRMFRPKKAAPRRREAVMGHETNELKTISPASMERTREKAFRYRMLNEPRQAESICRDILALEPENQDATRILLLSITDQFAGHGKMRTEEAQALLAQLTNEYDRVYYSGVILERQAKAQFDRGLSGAHAYALLREAMEWYEKAESTSPDDNDDAILRWNTCARMINDDPRLRPAAAGALEHALHDEDVPMR